MLHVKPFIQSNYLYDFTQLQILLFYLDFMRHPNETNYIVYQQTWTCRERCCTKYYVAV